MEVKSREQDPEILGPHDICSQEEERDECWNKANSLFLIQARTPTQGVVSSTFRVELLTLMTIPHRHGQRLTQSGKSLISVPEACLLGDSRICQVDKTITAS